MKKYFKARIQNYFTGPSLHRSISRGITTLTRKWTPWIKFRVSHPMQRGVFMNNEDENSKYSPTYIFWNFSYDLHGSLFRDRGSRFGHNFSIHKHFACTVMGKTSNYFLFHIATLSFFIPSNNKLAINKLQA